MKKMMEAEELTSQDKKLIECFKAGVPPSLIAENFKMGLSTVQRKKSILSHKTKTKFINLRGTHGNQLVLTVEDVLSGKYKNLTEKISNLQKQENTNKKSKQMMLKRLYRNLTQSGVTVINGQEFSLGDVTLSEEQITITLT